MNDNDASVLATAGPIRDHLGARHLDIARAGAAVFALVAGCSGPGDPNLDAGETDGSGGTAITDGTSAADSSGGGGGSSSDSELGNCEDLPRLGFEGAQGDTRDEEDGFFPTCYDSDVFPGVPDVHFLFQAPHEGTYTFEAGSSDEDLFVILAVGRNACTNTDLVSFGELACGGSPFIADVENVDVDFDEALRVVVDGYDNEDVGPFEIQVLEVSECTTATQTCAEGEKCVALTRTSGGYCTPVVEEPLADGEACDVELGRDACALGSVCWSWGVESSGGGICTAYCGAALPCGDSEICSTGVPGLPAMCLPTCEPGDCPGSEVCVPLHAAAACSPA